MCLVENGWNALHVTLEHLEELVRISQKCQIPLISFSRAACKLVQLALRICVCAYLAVKGWALCIPHWSTLRWNFVNLKKYQIPKNFKIMALICDISLISVPKRHEKWPGWGCENLYVSAWTKAVDIFYATAERRILEIRRNSRSEDLKTRALLSDLGYSTSKCSEMQCCGAGAAWSWNFWLEPEPEYRSFGSGFGSTKVFWKNLNSLNRI